MWELVEYTWCPNTGIGEYVYERRIERVKETKTVKKAQPAAPHHVGWYISLAHWTRTDN